MSNLSKNHSQLKKDLKIKADLVEACKNAIAYLNMEAQRSMLGLNKKDDDLRQQLCIAVGQATGEIICGNLQRTHETDQAIKQLNNSIIEQKTSSTSSNLKKMYILVDPNDDSGNDDGILDKKEMTKAEADALNNARRNEGSDLRWVLLYK